ncbi:MAG: PilZ domain-containing protein [Piscirickettsiaceae bacterium CG_4_9_14_3_um_filter_43_564]|nr:PilZ domain-containing protein [Thiomicrospira sp.]OIP95271.1 MAG: PilZ domain-containing protein [Thiomicrospira sp. CG2_30_44_34]PIQ02975.1 MAG: PilZ domain-containing protein [Piscirickettsiaceae bacterium CG18_big_fil_WC_8_21_14_2_50_44_103]PIU38511.1 MAG: PilZ domain-containing protein [Piscirickettsiaceae bacterium CG07_land_8_20_14_0_80_44_28]PIW57372.1 MAG: PilZ domain-containing protein [Piscirickettsiaceae bacterium CG12_big_fil_rev_8_21_14_0_65_44_934]PIW77498.1 MAG: PilZ domain-
MNRWFHKGNSRRFYRLDMPLKVFISPASPIRDRDIFATGIDYFPPTIKQLIEIQKNEAFYWIKRIQDQKVLMTTLFEETINTIEFFGRCAEAVSKGINPKLDPNYWMTIKQYQQGFTTIEPLSQSAPKTYRYFKLIEEKYLFFLNTLITSIEKSTPNLFAAQRNLPYGFKIDEILQQFKAEKFSKIPLIQAILSLASYMETYIEAYRQINDDNILRDFPEDWIQQKVNVSASGLSMVMAKRFKPFEKVDIFIFIPIRKAVCNFNGSIVDIRTIENQHKERIAINFEFPDSKNQNLLQNEIQRFEIEETLEIDLNASV